MRREQNKISLTHFHIAGFSYWDGCEAFENLKIGTILELEREQDNKFDPYAHPESQVEVIVFLKRNNMGTEENSTCGGKYIEKIDD